MSIKIYVNEFAQRDGVGFAELFQLLQRALANFLLDYTFRVGEFIHLLLSKVAADQK